MKDINFGYHQFVIRDGKSQKDRVTVLPGNLEEPLKKQLEKAKALHDLGLCDGYGRIELPFALSKKYPNATTMFMKACFQELSGRPSINYRVIRMCARSWCTPMYFTKEGWESSAPWI